MEKYIHKHDDGHYEYGFMLPCGKLDPHGRSWSREDAVFRLFSIRTA